MTIPEILLRCFNDLAFLAEIKDNQKVCFKRRYYVDKDGWSGLYGSIMRTLENERMDVSGIAELKSICSQAAHLFPLYKSDPKYGEEFVLKIIAAKKGVERLEQTYKSIGKTVEASKIRNSAILDLEQLIPDQFKDKIEIRKLPSKSNRKLDAKPVIQESASVSDTSEDENVSDIHSDG